MRHAEAIESASRIGYGVHRLIDPFGKFIFIVAGLAIDIDH